MPPSAGLDAQPAVRGSTGPTTVDGAAPAPRRLHPLLWVPTLYLAMGIPFNAIMGGTAARMYKSLGYADGQITVALGSIGIVWTLKPLWAGLLELVGPRRVVVIAMEFLLFVLLAGIALTLPFDGWFRVGIALLWGAAFASATHDICADGLYLGALNKDAQTRLAGLQGMFWSVGKMFATGVLVFLCERLRVTHQWSETRMWMTVWAASAGAVGGLAVWHCWTLPRVGGARPVQGFRAIAHDFAQGAVSFFDKRMFWGMVAFVFLYRFGEGLLLMEAQLFLQSPKSAGGLGLSAGEVSTIDAVWGTLAAILGGLFGGAFVARFGLGRVLWILALALNVPNFVYVYLSHVAAQDEEVAYATIAVLVSVEKFGYGLGFIGNMIYMMQQLAPGRCTMTHYAFSTAMMNLMLVPTNMISGPLADWLGFSTFFLVVMAASIPSLWVAWRAPFPIQGELQPAIAEETDVLGPAERDVQRLAGRASLFAMLAILTLLIVDVRILGAMHARRSGDMTWAVVLLLGSFAAKILCAERSLHWVRATEAAATRAPTSIFLRNARGACIATAICAALSLGVLVLGWQIGFGF